MASLVAIGLSALAADTAGPEADERRESSAIGLSHQELFAPKPDYPYFQTGRSEPVGDGSVYEVGNAHFLAEFSMLAYVKELERQQEILESRGFGPVSFIEASGNFGTIASRPGHIMVAFRGTETGDIDDYLTDAKVGMRPYKDYGYAHSGFLSALESLRPRLEAALAKHLSHDRKAHIWLAGHSLGGAIATLYALDSPHPIRAVYTIGMPRVGGQELANSGRDINLYRTVHDNDLVPRLPPPPFYQHFGELHFIASSGELLESPSLEVQRESQSQGHRELFTRLIGDHWAEGDFRAIPLDNFVDHSPLLYVENLKRLAGERRSR